MSRVFITQEVMHRTRRDPRNSKFNFTNAERFGRLVTLAPQTRGVYDPQVYVKRLRYMLADFNELDYLLPVGDPVVVTLAAAIAAHVNHGRFKVLKWDKRLHDYDAFQLITGEHSDPESS